MNTRNAWRKQSLLCKVSRLLSRTSVFGLLDWWGDQVNPSPDWVTKGAQK